MADESSQPPVLEYQPPQRPTELPMATRITFAVFASIMTLVAAVFLVGGLLDALDGQWTHFVIGLVPVCLAYVLWQPVGLRITWRRRHSS